MRVASAVLAAALLLVSIPASAHLFNHGTRHEDCAIYGDPHAHSEDDGHAHYHHLGPATTAHSHGGTLMPVGHTHADVLHDPCDQAGLKTYTFTDQPAIDEVPLATAVVGSAGGATTYVANREEAFQLPVAALHEQKDMVIVGDAALAAMGLPGHGTAADPYVIEGYLIRNVLEIRDTSKCVVVRHNVVQALAIQGPLVDPADIVDLADVLADAEAALAAAEADLAALTDGLPAAEAAAAAAEAKLDEAEAALAAADAEVGAARAARDAAQAALDEASAQRDARASEADAALAAADAAVAAADAVAAEVPVAAAAADAARTERDAALADVAALRDSLDAFTDDFEAFVAAYAVPAPPPDTHHGAADLPPALVGFASSYTTFLDEAEPVADEVGAAYEAYMEDYAAYAAVLSGLRSDVEAAAGAAADAAAAAAGAESELAAAESAAAAAEASADAAVAAVTEAETAEAAADSEVEVLAAKLAEATDKFGEATRAAAAAAEAVDEAAREAAPQLEALDGLRDDIAGQALAVAEAERAAMAAAASMAEGRFAYAGLVFATLQALVDHVLDAAIDVLDPANAGRLILDWNGICVNAYNNVVDDLRVNRNNRRTGAATGGLLEENRFYTIGQIRHFDGEFRNNEVGRRIHLREAASANPPPSERAINADGFNEADFHNNIIYGAVDLDLHGHHHSPGFFARESHYHGSDYGVAFMKNPDGTYMTDANGRMLPHHDHTKRWTSVSFTDNTIIDPQGYGLRYEDRDHAGDDRTAASEDMWELEKQHFHQTHIAVTGNDILGKLWVDVFNAPGIEIWSDDFSEVERDPVTDEIVDAIEHLGAERINSHPVANDGWIDLKDNVVFLYDRAMSGGGHGFAAIQLNDVETGTVAIEDNAVFVVPREFASSGADLRALMQQARTDPDGAGGTLASFGTVRTNDPQTTAILLRGFGASDASVCGNVARNFAVGLRAVERVYTDSTITTCPSNDWGAALVRVQASFTARPVRETGLTEELRHELDGSLLLPVIDPVFDEVDPAAEPADEALEDGGLVEAMVDGVYAVLPDGTVAGAEATAVATVGGVLGTAATTPAAPLVAPLQGQVNRLG
ncbi:MAG: hypothetical protein QOD77_1355 [Thermoplasmata archaeon]|jgi:hypothetical protein|nr:hypothetical protein [Thermoplasmata archaeon]